MRFSPQFLDDIRARLAVSDVVGRKVRLQKRGREFVGLSPFNPEKTPSFTVNDQKGFYHCFSSGKHGDIFRFVMETEGLDFPETVERLARDAGLELPKADPRAAERAQQNKTLYDVQDLACAYFENQLQSRAGASARGYLGDRGIDPQTQQKFRLGYAPPERHDLKQFLAENDVSAEVMNQSGLIISGEDIAVSYNRFRDRIMYPISDSRGRIIAFGGRALSPDAQAKYLNSPETPIFHKGGNLYNAFDAREAAFKRGTVIVVEGYMDVIALAIAGFANTVAPLGTALTEDQLGLLWRMADEPVICFDGDAAGRKAMYRAIDLALGKLQPGKSLGFALLPNGQDPDDLLQTEGREGLEKVLDQSLTLIDAIWQRETEGRQWETPERRAAFEARLREIVKEVGDPNVRRHYGEAFARRISDLWGTNKRYAKGRGAGAETPGGRRRARRSETVTEMRRNPVVRDVQAGFFQREATILMAMINHTHLIDVFAEELAEMELANHHLDSLRDALLDIAAHIVEVTPDNVAEALAARGFTLQIEEMTGLVTQTRERFAFAETNPGEVEMGMRQALVLHSRSLTLHKELRDAERALGEEATEENFERLKDIQAQLQNAEGTEALIDQPSD